MEALFTLHKTHKRDPAIDIWLAEQGGELAALARYWFQLMKDCGDDVREVLHDGHPVACIQKAPFAYVDAFNAHVNVGFFRGAALADPLGLLQGTGKYMRHVKLKPGQALHNEALWGLVESAYFDMRGQLGMD